MEATAEWCADRREANRCAARGRESILARLSSRTGKGKRHSAAPTRFVLGVLRVRDARVFLLKDIEMAHRRLRDLFENRGSRHASRPHWLRIIQNNNDANLWPFSGQDAHK